MKNERKRAVIFVLLVFLCGTITGALAVNLWDLVKVSADTKATASVKNIPPTTRKRAVKWFSEELALNPDQSAQLAKILDETRISYKDHEREIDEIRHEAHNRIRHILTDSQREKFNELLRERKEQRQAMRDSSGNTSGSNQ